jgi:predicted phosphodiesterase
MAFSMKALATKLAKKFPDAPSRTLAKRMMSEAPGKTLEQCRDAMRFARGNHGKSSAKLATAKRPNGKAGTIPELPPSLAKPWKPFIVKGPVKVAILSDIHIPYHSEIAVRAAIQFIKQGKVDCILLNGDIADFYTISRHQKNPAKRDLGKELEAQRNFLKWLRHEFPTQRILYKEGNHEERWTHWLWNHAPEVCDMKRMKLKNWLGCKKLGIEWVTDQRPIMLGKLPVFHGHELPRGMTSPVNPARGVYMRIGDTGLVGHHHRTSGHSEPNWKHDELVCWSVGCLCDMNPEYARTNKWNHGFCTVRVHDDQSYDVENMRINKDGTVRSN